MKLKLISCEVFYREMCATIARSPNQVDVEFMPKGLHDLESNDMQRRIQARLDAVGESDYDAVIFGYGLCNNGLHGLKARQIPVVIPRAHDCITLFFGCRKRYTEYFTSNPGVYFKTSGWIERGEVSQELVQASIGHKTGMDRTYDELVEQYGEDNAGFLYETLCRDNAPHYSKMTYIEMGVEPDRRFEDRAREDAQAKGWNFEHVQGDMTLIEKLVNGNWDEHFLVVRPGEQIVVKHDEDIIAAAPHGPE